jgi:hypothetical protein
VLPIVLYNGQDAWTAKTSLADLIEPDLPEQLRHWQPQIRYLLLEGVLSASLHESRARVR